MQQTLPVDQYVGQVLGNYRVERFLGKGRLNAVYLARQRQTQRMDALTLYLVSDRLSPEACTRFLTRFRKEAAAIVTVDHPHILPVYEYGELLDHPYLVTPYMMHGSLADLLKQDGRYDHSAVLPILEQLVSGLSYAHQKGFIHGTLRPSNVVVNEEGGLQVAGFGLMHMLQLSGVERTNQPYAHLLSVAGTFLAAPEYVAPEVVQGQSIDVRSDIYALGCILFELLSGRPPFTGPDPLETAQQHVTQPIPSLRALCPDLPVALSSVINQALERDPARRFQHVEELGEAFAQVSRGVSQPLREEPTAWSMGSGNTGGMRRENFLQETPRDGYSTNKWQLLPPIVTGKIPAVQAPKKPAAQATEMQRYTQPERAVRPETSPRVPAPPTLVPEAPRLPPNMPQEPATRTRPTYAEPAARQDRTMMPQEQPTRTRPTYAEPVARQDQAVLPQEQQRARTRPAPEPVARQDVAALPTQIPAQAAPINSIPGVYENDSAALKAYEWWSEPGEPVQQASAPARPEQAQLPRQAALPQSPLRLQGPDAYNWAIDAPLPGSMPSRGAGSGRKSGGKLSRRQAVALLATGTVAAVGTAAFLNRDHLHLFGAPANQQVAQKPQTGGQPKQPQNQVPTQAPAKPQPTTAPANNPPGGHKGTVIGNGGQTLNSANPFTNPVDKKASLLIRLPSGMFVAYETACTHEGVTVNYDPATKTLVCPAHGAIFDPANGGKVLQGPATKPIPMVAVRVNGDGTITTG